jgi:amino acid adenylation domain-containing protein
MSMETIEGFRLSPQQRRLWELQQLHSDWQQYRARCLIHIRGELDYQVLKEALTQVVQQNEIMRTGFRYLPGVTVPLQIIQDDLPPDMHYFDWRGLLSQHIPEAIEELFTTISMHPSDVSCGPLLRAFLVALPDDEHALILSIPALCADVIALKNIAKQLFHHYATGRMPEVEATHTPIQYADIAEWQNELLEGSDGATGKEFWQQQITPDMLKWRLPFARASARKEFVPREVCLSLSVDQFESIEDAARRYRTSPPLFLLICWRTLLWRLTRQSNVVIGVAYPGRKYAELADAVGLFARYLPLSCPFEPGSSFEEELRMVDEAMQCCEKWEEFFSWEDLQGQDSAAKEPLFFPVTFHYDEQDPAVFVGETSCSLQRYQVYWDRFDIQLSCIRHETGATLAFQFNSVVCAADEIERVAKTFLVLLEQAALNPTAPVDSLKMLADDQKRHMLFELNATYASFGSEQCIHTLFEKQAARVPQKIAVVCEQYCLTYAELNVRANQLAHYLRKRGVGLEALVVLCLERSLDMIVGMLAVLKAGGTYVPLVPALPKKRMAALLEDTRAQVLLTQEAIAGRLPNHMCDRVFLDSQWAMIARESSCNPDCRVAPAHLAYVLCTSGSSGNPKGVAVEHRQLFNYVSAIRERLDLPPDFSFATVSTFAADLGNTAVFSSLCSGGSLHIVSEDCATSPDDLAKYIQSNSIDCLKIVPSHLSALLAGSDAGKILPRRCLVLGGETVSWNLVGKIKAHTPECAIFNHYGPTETTVGVMVYRLESDDDTALAATVPLGRPLPNSQIYILDPQMQPVPILVAGEIYIGGSNLARGYLNQPSFTAERFVPDPFSTLPGARLYKTGDSARYLPDGNVEFLGRIDRQVKIRGFRIELEEIEALLLRHPAVQTCALAVREDAAGYEQLVAFVVSEQRSSLHSDELRSFLAEYVADYMVPALFVFLSNLPLTANGKIDRAALCCIELTRATGDRHEPVAPRDTVELQLLNIWEDILHIDHISVTDNFFDLGGHSLLAVRLMAQIHEHFRRDLPLSVLLQSATIEHLAKVLRQEAEILSWSSLVCIQPRGGIRPFFCIHAAGGNILGYVSLAQALGNDQPFYGLQAVGLIEGQEPYHTIEDMAAHYIQEMRHIQPRGPYLLGAWCMGAMIAYEMALMLQQQGQQVLLAFLDGGAPHLPTQEVNLRSRLDDTTLAYRFARHHALPLTYESLRNLDPAEQLHRLLEQIRRTQVVPPDIEIAQLQRLLHVYRCNIQAAENYTPQRHYAGKMALLRAKEEKYLSPTMGWHEFATDGVDVYEVPGDHRTLLKEPHVHVVAEHLRAYLAQWQESLKVR